MKIDIASCEIVAMTEEQAREQMNWQYAEPYEFYNTPQEYVEGELAEMREQKDRWFSLVDPSGRMVGFYEYRLNGDGALEIGLGMRPELTGLGYGGEFVARCIQFGKEHYRCQGRPIALKVADFNERAIKIYRRTGFQLVGEEHTVSYGNRPVTFLLMEL